MLEVVRHPLAYFLVMIAVTAIPSIPPSPPTLLAAKDNPAWLLATLAAVASAVTAVADWHLVRRVFRIQTLDRVRRHRFFDRAERMAKVAPFFTVFVFAALPLPFMIPRVLVPLAGYPVLRYALAVAVGRFPRIFVIASAVRFVDVPRWALEGLFAAALLVAAVTALLRRFGCLDRA